MPKLKLIDELEQWITLNECKGAEVVFKVMCIESELEGYYTKRVEGIRYGKFGVYQTGKEYRVTHLRTGGQCGGPFSSENAARRMIFCLIGLEDWSKVIWRDCDPHFDNNSLRVFKQVDNYCHGSLDCNDLLEKVKGLLPVDESDIDYEVQPIEFGSESKVGEVTSSGWGTVIT